MLACWILVWSLLDGSVTSELNWQLKKAFWRPLCGLSAIKTSTVSRWFILLLLYPRCPAGSIQKFRRSCKQRLRGVSETAKTLNAQLWEHVGAILDTHLRQSGANVCTQSTASTPASSLFICASDHDDPLGADPTKGRRSQKAYSFPQSRQMIRGHGKTSWLEPLSWN